LKGNRVGTAGSPEASVEHPVPLYAAAGSELETNPTGPARLRRRAGVRTRKKPAAFAGRGLVRTGAPWGYGYRLMAISRPESFTCRSSIEWSPSDIRLQSRSEAPRPQAASVSISR